MSLQSSDQQHQNQNQNHHSKKYDIGSGTTITHAVRLQGGTNIICSLQEVLIQLATTTSTTTSTNACYIITAVGSLSNVTIRMSSAPKLNNDDIATTSLSSTTATKKATYEQHIRTWNENLEIVSLVGTFGLQNILDNNNDCIEGNEKSTTDIENANNKSSSSSSSSCSIKHSFTKHLHIVVSDANGICYGGHLIDGIIFTTIELVFGSIIGNNIMFDRIYDPTTGYKELYIRTDTTGSNSNNSTGNNTTNATTGISSHNTITNNTCSNTNPNKNAYSSNNTDTNNSKKNSARVMTTIDDEAQDENDDDEVQDENDDNQLFFRSMDVHALQQDDIDTTETSAAKKRNVVRDWGIPTFKDQIDNGITTFTLNDCITINLSYRQNSTGSDVWDSAIVLANALERIDFVQNYITYSSSSSNKTTTTTTATDGTRIGTSTVSDSSRTLQDLAVLELGSGTGLVGLYCSKRLGAKHVYVSDLHDNLPLLERNIKENHLQNTVVSFELDWTKSIQEQILKFQKKQQQQQEHAPLPRIDLIIGSDLFLPYDKTLLQYLAICINELLVNYYPTAIVILCYEERFDCSNFFNYIKNNFHHLHIKSICNNYLHPFYQDPYNIKLIQITYSNNINHQ